MSDGKIVIDTDLDSSGLESGLKKLGSITTKGLKAATVAITGTATAMAGIATAAVKVGSDFEAQMSRVQAISGATGEEFEKLRSQAIELGADTAFSATEAAQGMENLAAAGFTTSEIMDAMPGMLNLAAAAGEDLASSADIAASTLRGFGLEASEAGHVADVLAENANRTNSSVSETGEAMKYVAPLARAAGISLEETAAAIGIMANAGIQGSQAGTTLRGALSRLSKPTDVMTQAMDELGVSFYDSEGKMLSLTDQVGMLQDAMEGMTDEQKNNYLVTLYGQEALSGMLALINEGEGSLADLTAAYENCDGAAETAAKTMQDNLKGAIEELSGSAESLGIVFYDSVADGLKDTVKVVNESVDDITEAFTDGGLDKAIKTAGDEFADLASEAADHAPDMVDAAVDFIDAFTDGIMRNRGELLDSAEDVATTLAGGLAKLLPSELREPVEDAVEAISDSLESGGLKSAGDTFRRTFETAVDAVGTLADVALPLLTEALDFAGDNMNHIVAITGAATAAFLTYRTATTAVATATTIAEKAQHAWNLAMNANPVGLVAGGIAAIVSALTIYTANAEQASEEQEQFNAEMDELNDKIQESKDGIQQLSETMKETNSSIDASVAPLERLKDRLDDAFDSTGKVKEGSEALAQSILNQLNDAMGTEYTLTADGFIQNNENVKQSLEQVSQSIDEYVTSLKQKALSEAASNEYAEAIQEQAGAQEALNEAQEKYNEALKNYAQVSEEYAQTHDYKALGEAEQQLNDTRTALEEMTGSAAAADAQVSGLESIMDTLGEGTPESIQKAKDAYASLPIEAQKASEGIAVSQQIIQSALASTDYTTMAEGFRLAVDQIEASGGEIPESLQLSIQAAINKFDELSPEAQTSAIEMMRNMMIGMESTVPEFADASTMSSEKILDTFRQYLVNSGALSDIGVESIADLQNGMKSQQGNLDQTSKTLAESSNAQMGSEDTKNTGARKAQEYNEGVESQKGNIDTTSKKVADSSNKLLGSEDTQGTGNRKGAEYNRGLSSNSGVISATAKKLSTETNSGMGSANTMATGKKQGQQYASGVGSQKGRANTEGKQLANSADSGASSVDGSSAGSGFGSGFVSGIRGWIGSAVSAAASLAASALQSAKDYLGIHSPSRVMRAVGKYFGQGFELGISGEEKNVGKASERLADAALNALDMSDISARMSEAMAFNTNRITRSFALESSSRIVNEQHTDNTVHLSDADIIRLSKEFGEAAGTAVATEIEGLGIYMDSKPVGKLVTPTVNRELGRMEGRKT